MAGLCGLIFVVSAILFLTQYSVQATISLPSFGDRTYVSKGSNVTLAWTYDFGGREILLTQWFFSNSSETLADITNGTVTIYNSSLPNINVTKPATLVLTNVTLNFNGTYKLEVTLRGVSGNSSEVLVIILEQPTAVIKCSSSLPVKGGKDITCLCSATGTGNPPATASWSKNGMVINGTGYLKKNLVLKNISAEDTGTYNCTVRSHNLTDAKFVNITLKPKYEPTITSFSSKKLNNAVGDRVEITCKADAFPEASYDISFNGSQLVTDAVNGVYIISSVNDSHAGNYTCVARNIIGSVSTQFVLTVKVRPTPTQITPTRTVYPSASMFTTPPVPTTTGARPGGEEESLIGLIVSAAIGGGVALLMICIVLIYCYCKHSYGRSRIGAAKVEVGRSNEAANEDERL